MLNIVIPMAGRGSRFANAGYKDPKPLIDVAGAPMIMRVTRNLKPKCAHRFIYICQKSHLEQYPLEEELRKEEQDCIIIPIDHITEGAACTVLLAKKYINNQDQLMIANSDQYVDIDINDYLAGLAQFDGLIMTMPANDPKWSFIKYDENKLVTLVREKEVISNEATVGIYNYLHGSDFVYYAEKMIESGKKIAFYDIGPKMHGLGTPEDLTLFLKTFELAKLKS